MVALAESKARCTDEDLRGPSSTGLEAILASKPSSAATPAQRQLPLHRAGERGPVSENARGEVPVGEQLRLASSAPRTTDATGGLVARNLPWRH